jgi:hypothetical protein
MTDAFRADLVEMLAGFVSSRTYVVGGATLGTGLLAVEKAQYSYLPNADWMSVVGYRSPALGVYLFARYDEAGITYKVEVLSQTSMVLLFRGNYFITGQVIKSDEQFSSFLMRHHFPAS